MSQNDDAPKGAPRRGRKKAEEKAIIRSAAYQNIEPVLLSDGIADGHGFYARLLKVRDGSKALALPRNILLKQPSMTAPAIGGGTAALLLLLNAPFIGLAAGAAIVLAPNIIETSRLRNKKDLYRHSLPEYRNVWLYMCHRFVRMVMGFNARQHTVRMLQQDRKKTESVAMMIGLLAPARSELLRVRVELQRFEASALNPFAENEEDNQRLWESDPLDIKNGAPALAWLELEEGREYVPIDEFESCLFRDLAMRQGVKDVDDALKWPGRPKKK